MATMYSCLKTTSDDPNFEDARIHVINYLLTRGLSNNGKKRPQAHEQESGIVHNQNFVYIYGVQAKSKNKPRVLDIYVACEDQELLMQELEFIKENNELS